MVFNKIKEALNPTDDKYEILYYKYSKIKLENQSIKGTHIKEMREYKDKVHKKVAEGLIKLYESIEDAKTSSFKVKSVDKELQRLLMDVNKSEKAIKDLMKEFSLEEVAATDRFYDPEVHDIASYEDAKGMAKGLVLKTAKKGFKFKGDFIKKPKVVVTK